MLKYTFCLIKQNDSILLVNRVDWKKIDWILHPDNKGVVNNIPVSIEKIIGSDGCYEYRCHYTDGELVRVDFIEIGEASEHAADHSPI